MQEGLQEQLTAACRDVLLRLYPHATGALPDARVAQDAAVASIASISV
jgi:hypothetical protein